MTYIPSIKGHIHVEGIDTIVLLYSSIKEILDLCSAAVVLFVCMKQFIDPYFEKQIKRRLQFIIVVELEALIKGKLHYTLSSHSTNRLAEQQQVNIHSLSRNRKMLHKGSLVQQSIALMSSLQAFLRKHNLLPISLSRMLVVRMWTLKHLRMNMLKFLTNPNIFCHVLISFIRTFLLVSPLLFPCCKSCFCVANQALHPGPQSSHADQSTIWFLYQYLMMDHLCCCLFFSLTSITFFHPIFTPWLLICLILPQSTPLDHSLVYHHLFLFIISLESS